MSAVNALPSLSIGWIGAGRMGCAMAARLLGAGATVKVWNRTAAKAAPLAKLGAKIVDSPTDLAGCDVVFTMVAGPDSFLDVTTGTGGVLTHPDKTPGVLIDCTTISAEASAEVRRAAAVRGTAMLDAPVSGNAKVVDAGKLSIVVSGDRAAFERVRPLLDALGRGVSYVGEGERARIVKICHNVLLGVVAQSLAEITVLAEKNGIPRRAFHAFLNDSVMGSVFTRYKAPAYVNLDFTPTFTSSLLRKDLDLGLAAARAAEVPMPLAAQAREIVQGLIGQGYGEVDFGALLLVAAKAAGLELAPDDEPVGTGL